MAEAMKAEVAKAEAMVKANYRSALLDASQQIQTREDSLNQMRIALDTSRTQAEEALKQQKVQMTAEIKLALDLNWDLIFVNRFFAYFACAFVVRR